MPTEQCGVGNNVVIPDLDVVREVDRGHNEVVIAQASERAGLGASMNRALLADDVVLSNDHAAGRGWIKGQVLGISANDARAANRCAAANGDIANELRVCFDLHSRLHFDGTVDDHIRSDAGTGINLRSGINKGGGMNHGERSPADRKLK